MCVVLDWLCVYFEQVFFVEKQPLATTVRPSLRDDEHRHHETVTSVVYSSHVRLNHANEFFTKPHNKDNLDSQILSNFLKGHCIN